MTRKLSFDERIAAKFANVELDRSDMHAYQTDIAVPFLKANPFSALFVDMGLGKSISSLTVIADLLSEWVKGKVLVIGPIRVVTDTWPTEIEKWRHTAWMNYQVIRVDDDDDRLMRVRASTRMVAKTQGKSAADAAKIAQRAETAERERILEELARSPASIHLINRERVEWLVNFHRERWPYRTVIIDESSAFKDHRTERFKALAKVRNSTNLITRLHELTATPAAESYEHLFAQIFLLDKGLRLGKKITHYREEYFTYNKYTMKWNLRKGAKERVLDTIKDICLVMKRQDYLPMDEPTIVPRMVTLTSKQMSMYRTMLTDFVVQLDDGTEIEAATAAALSSKLLQMASGVLYETYSIADTNTDDMKKVRRVHHLHDHKIEALKEIVEELNGAPVLVAYHFKSSLDRLVKAFPKAIVMDREGKCVKAWNAGKIPMLLMHPQSGGHGLNLQQGGSNAVFFDLHWSHELTEQFIGRIARQGQKNPVLVQMLMAKGTRDEDVYREFLRKGDAQTDFFRILRRLIRNHRRKKELERGDFSAL